MGLRYHVLYKNIYIYIYIYIYMYIYIYIYIRQRQNYLSGVYSFGVRTPCIVLQAVATGHIPDPLLATKRFFAGGSANVTATEWKLPQAGVPRHQTTRRPKSNLCKQSRAADSFYSPSEPELALEEKKLVLDTESSSNGCCLRALRCFCLRADLPQSGSARSPSRMLYRRHLGAAASGLAAAL